MSLILVSSLDSHCRDQALARLSALHPQAAVVRHDLLEGERVLRRVDLPGAATTRAETALEHGCLSCTVRLDVVPAVAALLDAGHRELIVGLPPSVPALQALAALAPGLARHGAEVRSVAAAVDPAALEDHLWDRHTLWESGLSSLRGDERTAGEFLIREFAGADTVLLVEGLFAHLLASSAPGCQSGGDLFARGTRLLRELAPHAAVSHPDAPLQMGRHDPAGAALRAVPGALLAAPQHDGTAPFSTATLRAERPLHPGRFRDALARLAEATVWLRGSLWVASAPGVRVALTGIGPLVWLESAGPWGTETAGTHIALTGAEVDAAEAAHLLRDCELRDDELGIDFTRQEEPLTAHLDPTGAPEAESDH